ncbi:DNA polymerase epsilon subunit 3 [Trichonephila clavipes]|nr:DNA polymerase epsilon subunit 3 [Trichonephila clavipes]
MYSACENRDKSYCHLYGAESDWRHLTLYHDEFHGPRSCLCRSVITMTDKIEELALPSAVISRILKDAIPEGINISKEARTAVARAASVFVLYATACSSQVQATSQRKTLTVTDVYSALEDMLFEDMIDPIKECLEGPVVNRLLENWGSDSLPILIKLKKRQLVPTSNNKQWIYKKVDWQSFAEAVDNGIKSIPLTYNVDLNWCSFKEMILRAAKKYITSGKLKNRKPYLSSKSPLLKPLLEERKRIFENRDNGRSNHVRIEFKQN